MMNLQVVSEVVPAHAESEEKPDFAYQGVIRHGRYSLERWSFNGRCGWQFALVTCGTMIEGRPNGYDLIRFRPILPMFCAWENAGRPDKFVVRL